MKIKKKWNLKLASHSWSMHSFSILSSPCASHCTSPLYPELVFRTSVFKPELCRCRTKTADILYTVPDALYRMPAGLPEIERAGLRLAHLSEHEDPRNE